MVVRMRSTKGHTRNRRSHHKVTPATLSKDTDTGALHERHVVDVKTGRYRGKKVIDMAPSKKEA